MPVRRRHDWQTLAILKHAGLYSDDTVGNQARRNTSSITTAAFCTAGRNWA